MSLQIFPADEVGAAGGLVAVLDEFRDALAARVLLQQAQTLGQHDDDLVVGERLTQGLDALVLGVEQVVLAAEDVARDVVLFQLGVHREDDVREQGVVLEPRMLGPHELDVRMLHGADVVVAGVPAGDPGRGVGPHRVDLGAARSRVEPVDELVFARGGLGLTTPPVTLALEDGFGDESLRQRRIVQIGRVPTGVRRAQVRHAERLGLGVLIGEVEQTPLDHLDLVDARFAEALHGQADVLQTGGLGGVRAADAGAAVTDDHDWCAWRPIRTPEP